MECAGHEFRQAEQPEHEGTDCIKKFWLKAFLIKSSNAEQNRNWRIWNPESSYDSEEKSFGQILPCFPPCRMPGNGGIPALAVETFPKHREGKMLLRFLLSGTLQGADLFWSHAFMALLQGRKVYAGPWKPETLIHRYTCLFLPLRNAFRIPNPLKIARTVLMYFCLF